MSVKKEGLVMIIGLICLVGLIAGGVLSERGKQNHIALERCQAYCNCSQDCPYTFDYDEVKGCECDK